LVAKKAIFRLSIRAHPNGALVAQLVENASVEVGSRIWRANDISVVGTAHSVFDASKCGDPVTISSISSDGLAGACRAVDHFDWASLLGMPPGWVGEVPIETWAEDPPFRAFDPAVVEVRAFDSTLAEVYSRDVRVLEMLRAVHGGLIDHEQR